MDLILTRLEFYATIMQELLRLCYVTVKVLPENVPWAGDGRFLGSLAKKDGLIEKLSISTHFCQ
ncbi:MAG: hypothetical protein H6659_04250 [Ardenticatenaceae bacterium]|nr:hypothetical protein [Ardenticatenaceae bacterium]